jgi:hypothetical protein
MAYRVIKQFADNPTLCASIGGETVALNAQFEAVTPATESGPEKKRHIRLVTQDELKYLFDNGTNIIEKSKDEPSKISADKKGRGMDGETE